MKKFFKYVGVCVLVVFSFFYTEKVVTVFNEYDPILKEIEEYSQSINNQCIEGSITEEGVILGVNGISVNKTKSYNNMKGIGFFEELIVFDEKECEVNKEKTINNYIVAGNASKNSVSLILLVNDGSNLEDILKILDQKNIKISFVVSGSFLESNKEEFEKYYTSGHDILYNGIDQIDLNKYSSIMKSFNKNSEKYCVFTKRNDLLELCSENNINSVKTNYIFENNIILNSKNIIEKGIFIMLKENNNTIEELGLLINYIKSKGLNIKPISSHLSYQI